MFSLTGTLLMKNFDFLKDKNLPFAAGFSKKTFKYDDKNIHFLNKIWLKINFTTCSFFPFLFHLYMELQFLN